jgi:hypothetical protein
MSVTDIIKHSVDKNPLAMKEALEAELAARIRLALEAKMSDDEEFDLSEMNYHDALKKDRKNGFYHDEEDGNHHVFGADSGFSYSQHRTEDEAKRKADEMNKTHAKQESFDL